MVRFKETGDDSFFGQWLYEQIVPPDHFLCKLNQVLDWECFTRKLLRYYKGAGQVGSPPYNPVLLLKMLLVSYLYNLSERQVEEVANFHLPVKHFLGLAVNQPAPDHSTLTLFKERLLAHREGKPFRELLEEMVRQAKAQGVVFGKLQIIDSVHSQADVNPQKEGGRRREGKPPRDPEATWKVKRDKGQKEERVLGHKLQVSLNQGTELITSLLAVPAREYDGKRLPELVKEDLAQGIPIEIVAADKGYDDGDNHYFLECRGIASAIKLNEYRTKKKDKNKGWEKQKGSAEYQQGLRQRHRIEAKFGEMKKWHGFGRCRYVGRLRYAVQAYCTVLAVNLKRLVKLIFRVGFRWGWKPRLSMS